MTTKLPSTHYLPLWEEASAQEIGINILCASADDQKKLVQALYLCRQEAGGFEDMMIFQPYPIGTIYIAHKTTQLD